MTRFLYFRFTLLFSGLFLFSAFLSFFIMGSLPDTFVISSGLATYYVYKSFFLNLILFLLAFYLILESLKFFKGSNSGYFKNFKN